MPMPNMTSGIIFIGLILFQAFQVIDCCNFSPFEDSRCYLELVNGQYIVRGLPQGTHMDFKICVIANGEIHNQNPVHRQECSQALQGYTVYLHLNAVHQSVHQSQSSSSHGTNIGVSASSSASTDSSHSDHHHLCYNNHPVYREIFDEAKHANCHRTYSVFIKLDYLRLSDHYCLSTLVREMAGLKLSDCECSDSSSHIDYSFNGQHEYHYHCMNIATYKDILTRYLSHVPYSGVMEPSAKCHTRNQLWQDLLQLRNSEAHYPTCFDDFVRHMKEAFMAYSDPPCGSCQTPAAHSTANHNYDAYIKGDCLSEHTVWSFLMEEHSDHYHGRNREQLIEHMTVLYPDGTDDKCVCSKAHDLDYPFLSSEDFRWSFTCRNNFGTFEPSSYQNVINHLFGSHHFTHSTQSCHSHAAVWQELNRIVKSSNYPVHCLETLIHILRDAVQKQGDPCSCHPVASTTRSTVLTTKMTTTTTHQMTATTIQPTTSTTQQATVSTKPTTTTAKPTTTTQSTTVPTTRTTFDWVTIKNTSSSTAAVGS